MGRPSHCEEVEGDREEMVVVLEVNCAGNLCAEVRRVKEVIVLRGISRAKLVCNTHTDREDNSLVWDGSVV